MSPGKKYNFNKTFHWLIAAAFLTLAFLNLPGFSSKANKAETKPDPSINPAAGYTPFASSGQTALYTLQGSGAGTANGDYVTAGMDTVYRYFIEVPAGLSRLQVELFDADIGLGGSGEAAAGRDRSRAGGDPDYNTSATYALIDPSGVSRTVRFTTGNSAGPTGSDNAWLALYNGTGNNVADNFGTAAYTNNNGNNNWATNWIEGSDDNSATGGAIQITGGELRLQDGVAGTPSIQREADLLGTPGLNLGVAYLSFDYRTSNNLEDDDDINVQVSSNGGGSWTTLENFSNDSSGSRQYDITSYIANNTRVRFLFVSGYTGTEFFFVDNLQIHDGGAITAGHWELRIDESPAVTTGDDINAIGIRAHDGEDDQDGTELNIYYDSHNGFGVNPPSSGTQSRNYNIYPYITSGCSCSKNDFDYDSDSGNTGSMAFTSRLGTFTQNYSSSSLSTDNDWRSDVFTGWNSNTASNDYGIWRNALTITSYGGPSGNYTNFYLGNYQAVDPEVTAPTVNPTANTFRVYLPTDSTTAPTKPYLEQFITYFSGPNPPTTGQQTIFTVTVRMMNQTSQAITFSASNLVTANVPGAGAIYGGSATPSQGSVVSQPSVGGTGNITWNPGTISAGGFAVLTYRVRVTPTSAGQRVPVTATPASGNGTRAQYVDETGNTTQARSTYLFGPICELAAVEGVLGPTAVDDVELTATAYNDGVHLEWKTGFETNNLGFNIYRDVNGERTLINDQLVAGSALMAGNSTALTAGMQYSWWDALPGEKQNIEYWIEDVDLDGTVKTHGPFNLQHEQGEAPTKDRSLILSALGRGFSTQEQYQEQSTESGETVKQTLSAKASRMQLSAQVDLASARAVKLSIRDEGWYRVPLSDLIAAGLDPNFNPQFLQLFIRGQEQSLLLSGAGKDAAIEFYASGQDTPYTNSRTCWITVGNQPGRRINIINATGEPASPQSFPFTTEYKERSVYFSALRNGEDENFFGRPVTPSGATLQIVLKNVDTAFTGTALLKVSLQGVTEFAGPIDHQVLVKVNGTVVGRYTFDGREHASGSFPIQHSLLREQSNDISLVSEAGGGDVSLVDCIRLTYQHKLKADNDSLRFTIGSKYELESVSSNPRLATVEDFTSPLIRVFDITNPAAPVEMAGKVNEAGGRYSVTVEAVDSSTRTFLAITADKIKSPVSRQANQPSSLRGTHNQADMIIITHASLLSSVAPLKSMREGQKLAVAVVDVEDIYDEFNFGERSPKAIKDFLQTANQSWKKAPRFVLLIGDATYDPKRYLGGGDFDLVPTKLVDATFLETASDDWFTDFNNDGLADLAIGRLPARTSEEARKFIAKLVAYEKAASSPFSRKALLVADRNDGFDFENATTQLRPLLPSGTAVQEVFRSKTTDPQMSATITEAINNGVSLVNFSGHGSTSVWRGNVFDVQAAKALRNSKALPMVVSMTCLNGYFHDPVLESLAEALLNSEGGGAIAVWASSALTDPKQQAAVNQELYRQLFGTKGQAATIGEAVMRAKTATGNSDVRRTWLLFGDPATRLK